MAAVKYCFEADILMDKNTINIVNDDESKLLLL